MVLGVARVPVFLIIEMLYFAKQMFTVLVVIFTEFRFVLKLHLFSVQSLENHLLVKPLQADEKTPIMKGRDLLIRLE